MVAGVYLGGGGSEQDEARLWDRFLVPGQRILYWPFALATNQHEGAFRWLADCLAARGDFRIEMWSSPAGRSEQDLADVDLLFVGGGNTFGLLDHLQRHHFLQPVRNFLDAGGAMYGGSAGAVLAGADIAIAGDVDSNDCGITDTSALDLLGGLVIRPHYDASDDHLLRTWARTHDQTILAVPERSGVAVTDGRACNVGPEDVHLIGPAGAERRSPGHTWSLVA
ncbi:Type 1 glutamine amidotransferase-like domain-containing protein [Actinopolymorpha cephalotaxi]|nr:Type 1 glutamine amidotransferase-like domain-containing protein [Actinopolymorpha cephalotaxi]NYH81442.1 dipeptidase E [Actinopolymorpha cephalotaxi]